MKKSLILTSFLLRVFFFFMYRTSRTIYFQPYFLISSVFKFVQQENGRELCFISTDSVVNHGDSEIIVSGGSNSLPKSMIEYCLLKDGFHVSTMNWLD